MPNTPESKNEVKESNKWLNLSSDLSREIILFLNYSDFYKAFPVCKGIGFFQSAPTDTLMRILKRPSLKFEFDNDNPDENDWHQLKILEKKSLTFENSDKQCSNYITAMRYKHKLLETETETTIKAHEFNRKIIHGKISLCFLLGRIISDIAPEIMFPFIICLFLPVLNHQWNTLHQLEADLLLARKKQHKSTAIAANQLEYLLFQNAKHKAEWEAQLNLPEHLLAKHGLQVWHLNIDAYHYFFSWITGKQLPPVKLKYSELMDIAFNWIKSPTIKNNLGELFIDNLMNIINGMEPTEITAIWKPLFRSLIRNFPTNSTEEQSLLKQFLAFLLKNSAGELNGNTTIRHSIGGGHDSYSPVLTCIQERNLRGRMSNDPIYEILNEIFNPSPSLSMNSRLSF